ncbi:ABC transporter substrate-binding protein [bacterium]|nr:ABC transporter substrate-binding protein [bacterium]
MKYRKLSRFFSIVTVIAAVFLASPVMAAEQHIKIGVIGDPQNWDPMDSFRVDWSVIGTSVFEGLVERDLDMNIKPGLATSWEILNQSKTIRFHLRKGVKFHSGHAFKADSVKYTFERILAKDSKSPQKGNYSVIQEVKIINDYTVDFMLKEIDPVMIVKLAGYGGVIVPKGYIEEKGEDYFDTHPAGTGPFAMVSYKRDQTVELVRFDEYWKKPLPKLEKVTFKIIPEATTRVAELQTGNIDIANRIMLSQANLVKDADDLELIRVDSPTVYSVRLDTKSAPTNDIRVREAIALAIDVDMIIETVLQNNGRRINSFQSKLSFGYDESLPLRKYDPTRAKQLLKEAGYDFDQTLTMKTTASDADFKEVSQAIQLYLKQIGIKTKLETVEANVYFSEMIPKGKAGHIFRQGWGGWTLDFDNTAYLLYHKGEHWNPDIDDPRVEELLTLERSTMDPAIRKKAFSQLSQRLFELIPDIPLYQNVELWGTNKQVKGFRAPADSRIRLENVYLED